MTTPLKSYYFRHHYLYTLKLLILFFSYLVTAKVGLSVYAVHGFATLIWAPTGIALAALFLYGKKLWPSIALGAFVVNMMTGATPLVAAGIALGNTLEGVVGAYLLKRFKFDPLFKRVRDGRSLIITGALVALISATIGVLSLGMGHVIALNALPVTWIAWWLGDTLGAFIFGTFLLHWLVSSFSKKTPQQTIEIIIVFLLLVGISIVVFWTSFGQIGSFRTVYFLFVPLIWCALRIGSRTLTLGMVCISLIATTAIIFHHGPFWLESNPAQGLFAVQIFMTFLVMTFLPFVCIAEEQKNDKRALEENIVKLENALQRISSEDQAKGEFLAILAHELRNPLAPVVSSLELMKIETEKKSLADLSSLVNTIERHITTVNLLLRDILDISRISHKKLTLQKKTLDLHSIMRQCKEGVASFYEKRKHELVLVLPPEPVFFEGDPLRIEQIIVNLLYNAAKYTNNGGRIILSGYQEREYLYIKVRDNGIGIAPEMQSEIFEPFTQAATYSKVGTGLGIGLALTKQLVLLHEGSIWVTSEGHNKGSEFIVKLPAHINNQDHLPVSTKEEPLRTILAREKSPHEKMHILVVDDNKAAATGISTLLKHLGYTVTIAENGTKALALASAIEPDVILLDIGLPDMSGYEVATKFHEENISSTLIALSGYGQSEDKAKAERAGFAYYLVKPASIVDVEALLIKIAQERNNTSANQ